MDLKIVEKLAESKKQQRLANLKISPSAGQIQPVEPMSPSAESPDHS